MKPVLPVINIFIFLPPIMKEIYHCCLTYMLDTHKAGWKYGYMGIWIVNTPMFV